MKKFRKILADHKKELRILGLSSIAIVGAYYLGRDVNIMKTDKGLIEIGNTGETLIKVIGNNMYELKVIKTEIE